jgi:hypothetical protein
VDIRFDAGLASPVLASWNGLGDTGRAVAAGEYSIKIESIDPFGRPTSIILSVIVLPAVMENRLNVFNSAGELVVDLSSLFNISAGIALTGMSLDRASMALAFNPATGTTLSPVTITLTEAKGYTHTLQWDGRNRQGRAVNSGMYSVQLSVEGAGGSQLISRQLEILATGPSNAGARAWLAPNPASSGPVKIFYPVASAGGPARVKAYDLLGQVVARAGDSQGNGTVEMEIGALASGIYLVDLEFQDKAGYPCRKVLRLAVVK